MEVVGLGAWCDIVTEDEFREQLASVGLTGQVFQEALSEYKRTASFRVSEFAVPGDGRRLTLHDEHGFSTSSSSGDPWRDLTLDGIEAGVRTTVLPDDDDTEEDHFGRGSPSCSRRTA